MTKSIIKKRFGLFLTIFIGSSLLLTSVMSKPKALKTKEPNIAKRLGWIHDDSGHNLCRGYYSEPLFTHFEKDISQISARYSSLSLSGGESILRGDVLMQHQKKQFHADEASYVRDPKTGNITNISLKGNIKIREPGRLLIAKSAHIDLTKHKGNIQDSYFRISYSDLKRKKQTIKELRGTSAWGHAKEIYQIDNEHYTLNDTTYSTCPPMVKGWSLTATKLSVNKKTGRASAKNAALRIHNMPILAAPYYSCPINDQSQTGFLIPSVGANNITGFHFAQPYYINLSQNYDVTLYPEYYSQRGPLLAGEFRYLNKQYRGNIYTSYFPEDRKFARFRQENPDIASFGNSRAAFHWLHDTTINSNWTSHIDYNAVSDSYYLKDLSNGLLTQKERKLLRHGDVEYVDRHQHFIFLMQRYQTLQLNDQATLRDTYAQFPKIAWSVDYPYLDKPFDFSLAVEYTHFFWPTTAIIQPSGQRFWVIPEFKHPIYYKNLTVTPSLNIIARHYTLRDVVTANQISQVIPQATVDSTMIFTRMLEKNSHISQTLEPRLFWEWTQHRDQDSIPLFDSGYFPFTYEQMFRNNRFSGIDRIGDTHHFSYGLQSRLINNNQGVELLRFGIGQMLYFKERKVSLCYAPNCSDPKIGAPIHDVSPNARFSPIASTLTLRINEQLHMHVDYAWDPNVQRSHNASLNFHYQKDNHIFHFAYSFQRHFLRITELGSFFTEPSQQLGFSSAWPLSINWSLLGTWSYNLTYNYAQTYYFGTQYDGCCWAMRLIAGKTLTGMTQARHPTYNNGVYLQILLRGLGSVANRNPAAMLSSTIPGFESSFRH